MEAKLMFGPVFLGKNQHQAHTRYLINGPSRNIPYYKGHASVPAFVVTTWTSNLGDSLCRWLGRFDDARKEGNEEEIGLSLYTFERIESLNDVIKSHSQ
jgi:hypothetical protein